MERTEPIRLVPPVRQRIADNGVVGMALFVLTEIMFFAGFISAFVIVKSSTPFGIWPPPDQPRLPVTTTAFNTAALLASGIALFLAHRAFRTRGHRAAIAPMGAAILLGGWFVVAQGIEWVALIRQGLTLTSSQLGSFFYLIVGAHAVHAVAAIGALVVLWIAMLRGRLKASVLGTTSVFWYFVVLVWPLLYWTVYL